MSDNRDEIICNQFKESIFSTHIKSLENRAEIIVLLQCPQHTIDDEQQKNILEGNKLKTFLL